MEQQTKAGALRDPELMALKKRKATLSGVLLLVMFLGYFGFMALLAFVPNVLAAPAGAATLGIPIGISLIVLAWVLTGIYVRWVNGAYAEVVERLKSK